VETIGAIATLLTALATLGTLVWQHYKQPTPAGRADARAAEYREMEARIAALESAGDYAAADALRRQLCAYLFDAEREPRDGDAPGQ
jgi:hypothetical protein